MLEIKKEECAFENAISFIGIALEPPKKIEDINTLYFEGYKITVSVKRKSGTQDEIIVIMPLDDYRKGIEAGEPVMVIGKVQTAKNFSNRKTLTYVFAEYIAIMTGEYWNFQNDVILTGYISKKGVRYRETPQGRKITELTAIVPNLLTGDNCYIPCICWGRNAIKASEWRSGDKVTLTGRFQSREYNKHLQSGELEKRITYEISARTINKRE